jgi:hypothetical protein
MKALIAVIIVCGLAGAGDALADTIVVRGDRFPVPHGLYESTQGTTFTTVPVEIVSLSLVGAHPASSITLPEQGSVTFDSFFDVEVEVDPGNGGDSYVESFVRVATQLTVTRGQSSFQTEIVSMELTGSSSGIDLRESPSIRSDGTRTSSPVQVGSDLFEVESFFNVYFEVSVNDGDWDPASGPVRVDLTSVVPLPPAALMGLGLLASIGGIRRLRRRRRGA